MVKKNILITGPPKSGKTRMLMSIMEKLRERNLILSGIICPEVLRDGIRWGFKIIDIRAGEEAILASVDEVQGPMVSKYRVNINNLERIGVGALKRAISDDSHVVIIDEIGKMELMSKKFIRSVIDLLDSKKPVIGIIAFKSFSQVIKQIKRREDVRLYVLDRKMSNHVRKRIVEEIVGEIINLVGNKQ